jgi:hypothetical protein
MTHRLIVTLLCCIAATPIQADQRYPMPGEPAFKETLDSVTARQQVARNTLETCMQKYIYKNATSSSDVMKLYRNACASCPKELKKNNEAEAAWFEFISHTNQNYHGEQDAYI